MTDFKAKMHRIRFPMGLSPRPRWGSLQRSDRPPSWIWGPLRGRGRGWAGVKGKGEGRGGRGKWRGAKLRKGCSKLLLNQGPSEPCYATARLALFRTSKRESVPKVANKQTNKLPILEVLWDSNLRQGMWSTKFFQLDLSRSGKKFR